VEAFDETRGKAYYYNKETNELQWHQPDGEAAVEDFMKANGLVLQPLRQPPPLETLRPPRNNEQDQRGHGESAAADHIRRGDTAHATAPDVTAPDKPWHVENMHGDDCGGRIWPAAALHVDPVAAESWGATACEGGAAACVSPDKARQRQNINRMDGYQGRRPGSAGYHV
jgi:hypothetical protein